MGACPCSLASISELRAPSQRPRHSFATRLVLVVGRSPASGWLWRAGPGARLRHVRASHPGEDRQAAPAANRFPASPSTERLAFGQQLQRLRVRAGLTQEVLAERAGLSLATMGALEQGRRQPRPHTAGALADALGLAAEDRTALLERASRLGDHPPTVAGSPEAAAETTPVLIRLPLPPTPLIGREAEVAQISALLAPAATAPRLITLTGPGGVGKTRLALEVANQVGPQYRDGAVFVDLAPVRDQRLVPASIAYALQISESAGRSARELLLAALQEWHLLLMLDNFEHLLGAAPLVADLLASCAELKLLVTSRSALRVRGERRLTVAPLPVADPQQPLEVITAGPAVRLFVERAESVVTDFALDAASAPAVGAICRQLEGIPLAIELAAARVGLLQPGALLRRLEHRLPLLTRGALDLPERQQSLRQTLAWSHDLLGPTEQVLFRRLAVFAGGWTLDAAESICTGADLTAPDVLESLSMLVDASLVQRAVIDQGEGRFSMLETIREDARERLEAAGEAAVVAWRHLDWYAAFVARQVRHWSDPASLAAIDDQLDNVRAALRWSVDQGALPASPRLAWQLGPYWYVRGNYEEGRMWLEEALSVPRAADGPDGAWAHAQAGQLARCQADVDSADAHLVAAHAVLQRYPDERCTALILGFQADVARDRGDLERARELFEQARALSRRLGRTGQEAAQTALLANVLMLQGDLDAAEQVSGEALELADRVTSRWARVWAQSTLGQVAAARGNLELARSLLEEVVEVQRAGGYTQALLISLLVLAEVAGDGGDIVRASMLLNESLHMAMVSTAAPHVLLILEEVAGLNVAIQPLTAIRLAGAAEAQRVALGIKRRPIEEKRFRRTIARATDACDAHAFEHAWAEGSRLTPAQANLEALDVTARLAAVAPDEPDGAAPSGEGNR